MKAHLFSALLAAGAVLSLGSAANAQAFGISISSYPAYYGGFGGPSYGGYGYTSYYPAYYGGYSYSYPAYYGGYYPAYSYAAPAYYAPVYSGYSYRPGYSFSFYRGGFGVPYGGYYGHRHYGHYHW